MDSFSSFFAISLRGSGESDFVLVFEGGELMALLFD